MDKHYQLSITDDTTAVNVDTIDPEAISRILALAGVKPAVSTPMPMPTNIGPQMPPPGEVDIEIPSDEIDGDAMNAIDLPFTADQDMEMGDEGCAICGASDHTEMECPDMIASEPEIDEVADYDLANQDLDNNTGHELDRGSYIWQGPATPQRQVKGMQGDNPLINEFHTKLLSDYEQYLLEMSDEEKRNEDGILSPLSDPTKPHFDRDPTSNEEPVDDGSRSPLSRIKRQAVFK
jgi:hypothetical protein